MPPFLTQTDSVPGLFFQQRRNDITRKQAANPPNKLEGPVEQGFRAQDSLVTQRHSLREQEDTFPQVQRLDGMS